MRTRGAWGLILAAFAAAGFGVGVRAEESAVEPPSKPVFVSAPAVPTSTPAVRDLPDYKPDPSLFGLEMKRREDFGFIPIEYPIKPTIDPLMALQWTAPPPSPNAFSTLVHNYAGQTSAQSPPDTTGDVGLTYYVQTTNQTVSTAQVINKATGAVAKTFTLQSLASTSPCNSGFCDANVIYDRAADRWFLSELPSSGGNVCVYVSKTGDPTGAWWAYTFAVESSTPDYPKYGVWPQNGNGGSYLLGVNAGSGGRDIFAFDRAKMLAGQPASFQKWTVPSLANSGFQLVLPSDMQGNTPPPNGEPALFIRPHDDEAEDGASTSYDLLDMWTLIVDWTTPANSVLTQLTSLHIGDFDMTLCGVGTTWNCMPQPGTTQKLDPIREPLHFPLHYRNFGDHQTLVGTFPEDVDGTDHSALRWFELRKSAGAWTLFQEGLVGGEANVHRSVGSIAMDQSGNIALGYTRTGTTAPYYPSIYYKGRLASDPAGTMPQGEYPIQDGGFSKTGNERWGDYAGMAIDPSDDCTFWFTTEYMTSGTNCATKVAAFKFDACGCLTVPPAPSASASVPQDNRIDVGWNDSSTASIVQYQVFRATTSGGPYTQIATVADSSPGVGNGPSYTYHDDTVSGGTRYYYVVKSSDGVSCVSPSSTEVNALATGTCTLAPGFAGLASIANPASSTCTLNLSWTAGSSACSGGVTYSVYRSTTTGFVPSPATRIAVGVTGTSYGDAVGIATGTTYYYIVRAVDSVNGLDDGNTVEKNAAPTGPPTTSSFTDTFEGALSGGGFDLAGWTKATISGSTNWVWSTTQKHDGTHSWFAQDITSTNDKVLVSPSFGVGAPTTLSFWHTYAFEGTVSQCYDGGTLEYTTNGGTTWTVLPAGDFTAGGYTGTANSGFSNPIGGKRAWCAGTIGTMTQVSANLGGDANLVGRTVQLRWHEGDDSSAAVTGWYVDTVTVSNAQVGGTCSTGSNCTAPGAPALTAATPDCAGAILSWSAGSGSTSAYNVYRGTTSGGPYTKLGGMPIAGTSYTDTSAVAGATYYYVVTGSCDGAGVNESSKSNELVSGKKSNGAACNDGNACTQSDTCQSGACVGANPVVCTASDACHTAGTCDTGTGACSNPAKPNGTACNDGNACTAGDTCQSGICTSGSPVVCTPSDACHDAGTCDIATGACSNPAKAEGSACSDGNACTQSDSCQSGVCVGGSPIVCTASDACHAAGTCDAGTGVCSNPAKPDGSACDDGNACTLADTCRSGACVGANPVVCVASDTCHDAGTCDAATGACSNPAKADGSACSDGNACTQTDTCQSGACVGTSPIVCTASDACHTAGTCDPLTGSCSNPAADDGTACNDGNACTKTDTCQSGVCLGGNPLVCNASDPCHTAGVCNPFTGSCSNPAAVDGTACNDGNACTKTDSCQSGACVGANPITCMASDQCHDAGSCDAASGQCSNPAKANGTACNDGNACTTVDSCESGSCMGSSPVLCFAADQCHDAGFCDPSSGACSNPARADGAACDDGNACTSGDTCSGGLCQAGAAVPGPGATAGAAFSGPTTLSWAAASGATAYDVVRGTLSRRADGHVSLAPDACIGARVPGTSIAEAYVPAAGEADWYLIRAVNGCGVGTYDDGSISQTGPRDADAAASPAACP